MYWRVPLTSHSSEALITSGWHPSPQVGGWEDALTLTCSNGGTGCGIKRHGQGSPLWSLVVSSQSIAEILQSFFQGAAYNSCAKLLVEEHALGRSTCDFHSLAFSCPYCEGLGLRDMVGRLLPMSHHSWADSS